MQGRQERVADQIVIEIQHPGQFVAPAVELDAEKADIGHAMHQRVQRRVAALLDHLHRFGTLAAQNLCSTVKAPEAVATGFSVSSSTAVARTKATLRVM